MRLSLVYKLVLTFLFVDVIAVGLLAILIRRNSPEQLSRLMVEQSRNQLKSELIDYYQQNGSFAGVAAQLDKNILPALPHDDHRPASPTPGFGAPHVPPRRQLFGLVDADGIILSSLTPEFPAGTRASTALLESGEPIYSDGKLLGTILTIPEPPEFSMAEEGFLRRTDQALFQAAFGALTVALILGVVFAGSLSRPLFALTQAANRISHGDLEQTVEIQSNDEIGELARAFNHMSQEVARANRLRRQMTSDIAHDLRTPLTVISGFLESFREGVLEVTPQRLDVIYSEVEHLERLVADLRTLAHSDAGELTLQLDDVYLYDLLENIRATYQLKADQKHIQLRLHARDDLAPILGDKARLAQVLGNLLTNALRYTPKGGQIDLCAYPEKDQLLIEVRDSGSGIHPDDLPFIFSRLFRGDKARTGGDGETGLGLAIAKALVIAHGGQITAESSVGQGTTIKISFPQAAG
jgi:signal transduction histidine kinase